MNPVAIEADNLRVSFARPSAASVVAIRDLDLRVAAGEFVAVIGRSGAGKTTLLRCLTGFVSPAHGRLIVDGIDLRDAGRRERHRLRRRVATIYQHFNLVERSTALDNVLHGRLGYVGTLRSVLGIFPRRDREWAYQTLIDLGLAGQALQRVDQLSGGERQRVAVARALLQEPRIVLADEPAASLDVALTRLVLDVLQRLHEARGVTILVNMHDLELARAYADRILALRRGELVFDGTPAELTPGILETIYHETAPSPAVDGQPVAVT